VCFHCEFFLVLNTSTIFSEFQMWVTVGGNVRARVQISEVLDEKAPFKPADGVREPSPLTKFHVGDEVTGRVFGIHVPKEKGGRTLDVTLKPSVISAKVLEERKTLAEYAHQDKCFGYLTRV